MKNSGSKSKKSNQGTLVTMGVLWVALGLFGLIFDPEKKVIIASQFIIGAICPIIFVFVKLRKAKD